MSFAVEVRNLDVRKQGRPICFVPELEIPAGEHLAVTGPNGVGKTTLLRVMMGLEIAYAGQCRVSVPIENRGFVHQHPVLFQDSVIANVGYGLKSQSLKRAKRNALCFHWLEVLGVRHLADRPSRTLSGGEIRRAALARAFVLSPDLLLLDEPFAELDDAGILAVRQAFDESSATIVFTSPSAPPASFPARRVEMDFPQ